MSKVRFLLFIILFGCIAGAAACGTRSTPQAATPRPEPTVVVEESLGDPSLPGGIATVFNTTGNAFGQPSPGLERMDELFFFVGNSFFNQNWVTAPASTTARDGLGPLFNARSCAGCHFKDGRGRPPEFDGEIPTGFLVRLSVPGRSVHYEVQPDPIYGTQLQEAALLDLSAEGQIRIEYEEIHGKFADGTPYTLRKPTYHIDDLAYGDLHPEVMISPRVANQVIGLGLLEAIPEERLLSLADPTDQDGDGISGRPNYVRDFVNNRTVIGRFGWKANQPHLLQQVASAFSGDMGITTSIFPQLNCTAAQTECADLPDGGTPEIDDDDLLKVVLYTSTLAVPARRNMDQATVEKSPVQLGETLFHESGCAACHTPYHQTGVHPTIAAFSHQHIYPYTDLLLHDMGPDLADGRPDFQATGSEWRTPPLWGIGLFETVNGHTYLLHDGRARSIMEAILWHGGEGEHAKEKVLELNQTERDALVAFVESL